MSIPAAALCLPCQQAPPGLRAGEFKGVSIVARRRGYAASLAQRQPQMERERAARERAQRQAFREAERAQRAYERATTANEKEKKRLYREAMLARAAAMTDDVETNVSELEGLLPPTGRRQ